MPGPVVTPNASGLDVPKIIKQLIELEREPLKRLEEDNRRNEIRIQAWEELRSKTKKLSDLSREIYSFTGPFATRKLVASREGFISGTASPNASDVKKNINIIQLAKQHKFHSREVSSVENLPSGKFSILIDGKESHFEFFGGSVFDLERLLKERRDRNFEPAIIKKSAQSSVLVITSKIYGERGKITFKDYDGLLQHIGLIGPKGKKQKIWEEYKIEKLPVDQFRLDNGKIVVEDTLPASLVFPDLKDLASLKLSFRFDVQKQENEERKQPKEPEKITLGPLFKKEIEGIELESPVWEQTRIFTGEEKETKKKEDVGMIVITYLKYGALQKMEMPLQMSRNEYLFPLSETEPGVEITEIRIEKNFQGRLVLDKIEYEKFHETDIVYEPLHEIDPAQNAKLTVNGVPVERSGNTGLDDIIPGVSMNLLKPTGEEIEVGVEYETSKIKEKILEWVEAYNKLLTFIRDNDQFQKEKDFQMQRSSKPDERIEDGLRKLEDASGIFAGDPVVRRLVGVLNSVAGSSYPSRLQPAFRTLAQIGITTGKPGSSWEDVKRGLLVVDEEMLEEALKKHPESVKELFASDKNSDGIIDDGVSYRMYEELSPYVQIAGGIITSRINLLKEQIRENKKIIYNKELSILRKEEMLKTKFGNMESTIQNMKSTQKFLQNRLGGKDE